MRELPEQVQELEEGAPAPGEAGEEGERQGTKETRYIGGGNSFFVARIFRIKVVSGFKFSKPSCWATAN